MVARLLLLVLSRFDGKDASGMATMTRTMIVAAMTSVAEDTVNDDGGAVSCPLQLSPAADWNSTPLIILKCPIEVEVLVVAMLVSDISTRVGRVADSRGLSGLSS